ncbi:SLC13 family permease [Lutimonas halocynthiae]|uniref:SLC13 family permease n=1 Tax=Lutimonas halocynthiae TaxID=1446477 RepID=UPI0025B5E0D5|nr:SLC13 family permease [Lutimonas halocynthiae]MDN3644422.1 SLC13 family permease [Lutimonas halocynthiae]
MADSRTASMRYLKKFQHVVDIQQKIIYFLLSAIFAFVMTYWINSPELDQAQVYVLFLLFFSIGLWVTEAVPPFAVGLLIFGFLVFALGGYYAEIDPENASKYVAKYVQTWSNSVIWLMLGGFVMAEAMQKVGLDKTLFKMTISKFGTKPRNVLLGIMLVTAIFSMIMSNTATTAMMIAAVIPFINTLDKNSPFAKALLIGIPAAASLGGMGTIIGSPPNAIAVDAMSNHGVQFGFLEWMMIGFPVAVIMVLLFWVFLISRFVPKVSTIDLDFLEDLDTNNNSRIFIIKRKIVLGVLLLTLVLWLTGNVHGIPASAVSLLPIMLLTLLGIVSGNDVRKLPWDTLMLVAGGLSLGLAIQETGLAEHYVKLLNNYDLNLYALMAVFSLLTVILSNFMSNTATTTILIPIAIILVSSNQVILPLVIGLSASAALFLPISTPPNAIAFSTGKLDQKDFRAGGLFAGILGPVVIIIMVLIMNALYA